LIISAIPDNYYCPEVVPSYAKYQTPDTMFTTLGHRFTSSLIGYFCRLCVYMSPDLEALSRLALESRQLLNSYQIQGFLLGSRKPLFRFRHIPIPFFLAMPLLPDEKNLGVNFTGEPFWERHIPYMPKKYWAAAFSAALKTFYLSR